MCHKPPIFFLGQTWAAVYSSSEVQVARTHQTDSPLPQKQTRRKLTGQSYGHDTMLAEDSAPIHVAGAFWEVNRLS